MRVTDLRSTIKGLPKTTRSARFLQLLEQELDDAELVAEFKSMYSTCLNLVNEAFEISDSLQLIFERITEMRKAKSSKADEGHSNPSEPQDECPELKEFVQEPASESKPAVTSFDLPGVQGTFDPSQAGDSFASKTLEQLCRGLHTLSNPETPEARMLKNLDWDQLERFYTNGSDSFRDLVECITGSS